MALITYPKRPPSGTCSLHFRDMNESLSQLLSDTFPSEQVNCCQDKTVKALAANNLVLLSGSMSALLAFAVAS